MRRNCRLTTKFHVFVAKVATVVFAVTEVVNADAKMAVWTVAMTIRARYTSYIR